VNLRVLEIAIQTGEPVVCWGLPGVGKTYFFKDLFESLDWYYHPLVASSREPVDFSGLPVKTDEVYNGIPVVKLAPIGGWVTEILKRTAKGQRCVIFLDEYSTAPPATQAATLKMIHERIMGELQFSPLVSFVAAANPADCAANGWELLPPTANRFFHYEMEVDVDNWVMGMLSGWQKHSPLKLDENWRDFLPDARSKVASFIQLRPMLLHNMPEAESERGRAWASNRSWDMAATLYAAALSIDARKDDVLGLFAGAVGYQNAIQFTQWLDALDLPDPEELLKNPASTVMPKRGDQVFAMLSGVISAVIKKNTAERWCAAWEVLAVCYKAGAPDVAATAARALTLHRPVNTKPPKVCEVFSSILEATMGLGK
jgi:hypothetical protein